MGMGFPVGMESHGIPMGMMSVGVGMLENALWKKIPLVSDLKLNKE